jgi:AcrR family transcriptional regulator
MGYELDGRVGQKQRTRQALVAAARELVAEGATPSVEQAAEHAGISRTTAYRYFPSQDALLVAAHPEITTKSLLPARPPADVGARVDIVVGGVTELLRGTEKQQRAMLRLSLEPERRESHELLLRQGRVIGWLEEALAPLATELGDDMVHSLAVAIRSSIGIEAYVWLTDVAHVPPDDAIAIMRWTARSQLDAAQRGSLPPGANKERDKRAPRRTTRHRA